MSEGPFDPDELVRWAEMYGHPEEWCKRAQQAHGRAERLQEAIDKAYAHMNASQYVGGPSERDAWRTAFEALGSVVTQHTGQGAPGPEDA